MHPLLQRQQELEEAGVSEGIHRFRQRIEQAEKHGRASQVGAAKKLLQTAIAPLAQSFQDLVDESKGRRGPKHYVLKWIQAIGPEPLAYLTIKTVLDHNTKITTVREIAFHLAQSMVEELRLRRLREQAPGLFDYRMNSFTTSNTVHMMRALDATIRYAEIDTSDLEMTQQVKLVVGVKLIDMLITATGLVRLEHKVIRTGKRLSRETRVLPTKETVAWINKRNSALEAMWPVSMPMVVPPLKWAPGTRGGYRFALHSTHRLVRGLSKDMAAVMHAREMPRVYEALNHIQDTAWRVNAAVYSLVEMIVQRGGGMAGIPSLSDEPMPPKPLDIATNEVTRKAWRKAAHRAKERNHARKLQAMAFHKTFVTAREMKDDAAIYFPCTLDFRGRVYPVTNYLNPQGDDLAKGLLTFAEGKLLGSGAVALALHGANKLGKTPQGLKLSKATLQERVDAIVGLTPDIERWAADPMACRGWCDENVDKPLQFYAFCVEWAAFVKLEREGRGHEFVSSLPCAVDGTCNGLQHFSALLCDPIGGAAVNVVPGERPQDIYERISDAVLRRLEQAASSNEHARLWLSSGLVDRKLAKRPTMTFGYGSKRFGFRQQLIDYVRTHDRWSELRQRDFTEDGKKPGNLLPAACGYMSGLIWDALQEIVVAASRGMQWMQEAARYVAAQGVCAEWTVPLTAFPVRQFYMEARSRQIETMLHGRTYKPRVYTVLPKPDLLKQSNAVAPNFVHSLDAATLMLTVNEAARRGVTSFGMVHDSYATHAADCAVLAEATREMFAQLYTDLDVIGDLSLQLSGLIGHPDDFPQPPEKGALDVTCVRQSLYFFS